jgi:hypothetical protein
MVTKTHQDAVVHLFLPGLAARPHPTKAQSQGARAKTRIYFHQGDLDGACGIYALFMALVLQGRLARRSLRPVLARMQSQYVGDYTVHELYFNGCDAHDLIGFARSLPTPVRCAAIEGSHSEVLRQVIRRISSGKAVLLGVENKSRRYRHWVLIVGVEYCGTDLSQTTALLGLDPAASCGPPRLRAFNWRLELDHPRRGARYLRGFEDSGSPFLVTCTEAVWVR